MSHYSQAEVVFRNEISALQRTLGNLQPAFDAAVDLILSATGKVVVTGVGKSGIIAHKIAATLASTGTPAVFLNAAEGLHGDLGVVGKEDVVLMLSNSAETEELYRLLPSIKHIGARLIGIFGNSTTKLARHCDCLLDASIEAEACPLRLAPMTSTTVALVIGDALAAALMKARGFTREEFAVFHPGGALGRRLLFKVSEVMVSGPQLPIISPDCSLREAVVEMDRCNIGVVVAVTPGKQVAGLLSEGDLRRLILREVSMATPLAEVMTKTPLVVDETAALGEALAVMEKSGRKVYVLPVVDSGGELVGALRMHDIVGN
jgi:arabinose-5-phosphate isomerase